MEFALLLANHWYSILFLCYTHSNCEYAQHTLCEVYVHSSFVYPESFYHSTLLFSDSVSLSSAYTGNEGLGDDTGDVDLPPVALVVYQNPLQT